MQYALSVSCYIFYITNLVFSFCYDIIFAIGDTRFCNKRMWRMMNKKTRVIAVYNQKGGSGKSTTAISLADVYARKKNLKVLIVDSDTQATASTRFGWDPELNYTEKSYPSYILNELEARERIDPYAKHIPPHEYYVGARRYSIRKDSKDGDYGGNLKLLVSNARLERAYMDLNSSSEGKDLLADMFSEICETGEFDVVVIDMAPGLGFSQREILMGTDYIVTPCTCDMDSIDGALRVGEAWDRIERHKPSPIVFLGIFFNMVKKNTKATRSTFEQIDQFWATNPRLDTIIPMNQDVNNATNKRIPVTIGFPNSSASKAFDKLANEILKRIETIESTATDMEAN